MIAVGRQDNDHEHRSNRFGEHGLHDVTEPAVAQYQKGRTRLGAEPETIAMVLLVEPNEQLASRLLASLDGVASVHRCVGFNEARDWLRITQPDLLVSNLRLGEFNGLQLVYCAASAATPIPAIVYTNTHDRDFAREIQRAGAFYDTADCLAISLRSYLAAPLPSRDRRDPQRLDGLGHATRRRVTDRPAEDSPRSV